MYKIGQLLMIEGEKYKVEGKIEFKNLKDGCLWEEFRLIKKRDGLEYWLAYDNIYKEYSLTRVIGGATLNRYHLVDSGQARVTRVDGVVDAEVGDVVNFEEYEDSSEENIISIEKWEDEEEVSEGYYLDRDEVRVTDDSEKEKRAFKINWKKILIVIAILLIGIGVYKFFTREKIPTIKGYLEKDYKYTYVTSITGEGSEKADVYGTYLSVTQAITDIIRGVEGNTEDVKESAVDNSATILTEKEYCLVYEGETKETLVQISSRKYAYTTDKAPYHSNYHTHSFYRNYYFHRGFMRDSERYGRTPSAYEGYSGDTVYTKGEDYNNYSRNVRETTRSVRQSSVGSRIFSGGGLSSGK